MSFGSLRQHASRVAARRVAPAALVAAFGLANGASVSHAQAPPPPPPPPPAGGTPLAGLSPAELQAFNVGKQAFLRNFFPQDGLGPVFNDSSCAACHGGGQATGGGSARLVTRFGSTDGVSFDPLAQLGGSLVQSRAIQGTPCNIQPEVVPPQANVVAQRRTQPLFGLGLVDATADATFETLASQERLIFPATAGHTSHVTSASTGLRHVGRFGWKAQEDSLTDFSGDAMLNEIGLTNPLFPSENCPQGDCSKLSCNPRSDRNDDGTLVRNLASFQEFLAPPARGPITTQVTNGERTFNSIGCAACHVASLTSGASATAGLNGVTYHPYSDFLLHDMGRLGDGIVQGEAAAREMRTAPLWGVSREPRWLHDGRAATLQQAITAHDGQGATSARAFTALTPASQSDLIAFLNSL